MGYANWCELNIINTTGKQLNFKNAQHEWGKFYSCEDKADKDHEFLIDEVNLKVVPPSKSYKIGACGRENTWSGCDGSFDLYDMTANVRVATVKFYSPHGTSYNRCDIDCPTKGWQASQSGAYLGNDQALGAVNITVTQY